MKLNDQLLNNYYPDESTIEIVRSSADHQSKARLVANLATKEFTIEENGVTVQL